LWCDSDIKEGGGGKDQREKGCWHNWQRKKPTKNIFRRGLGGEVNPSFQKKKTRPGGGFAVEGKPGRKIRGGKRQLEGSAFNSRREKRKKEFTEGGRLTNAICGQKKKGVPSKVKNLGKKRANSYFQRGKQGGGREFSKRGVCTKKNLLVKKRRSRAPMRWKKKTREGKNRVPSLTLGVKDQRMLKKRGKPEGKNAQWEKGV